MRSSDTNYIPTIGLEIHAQLNTKTKLFCNSKNDPNETRPNVNVCPICMGHPGTLPTINEEAVRHILRVGTALGGELSEHTHFDRKNYFYPDIPKGYQISQYQDPLVSGGTLTDVSITRIHLEEDTARSLHERERSLVDFNRAGVPLMELVTEPVIKTAQEAGIFARELQLLLRYLGAGEANLEKGEMRVEANVSVSSSDERGTKVEVKNLNSFRSVERAIVYEIKRQSDVLECGGQVMQETRGWDERKQKTFSQRKKEEAHDYRYFPEPDLAPLSISEIFDRTELKRTLPELPWEKRKRYCERYGMTDEEAELFVRNGEFEELFETTATKLGDDEKMVRLAINYIKSDVRGYVLLGEGEIRNIKDVFADVVVLIAGGEVSSRGAKELLPLLLRGGGNPSELAKERGLLQQSDEGELIKTVNQIIKDHPSVVEDYRKGKEAALQFLVGRGMELTRGSANPAVLKRLFVKKMK